MKELVVSIDNFNDYKDKTFNAMITIDNNGKIWQSPTIKLKNGKGVIKIPNTEGEYTFPYKAPYIVEIWDGNSSLNAGIFTLYNKYESTLDNSIVKVVRMNAKSINLNITNKITVNQFEKVEIKDFILDNCPRNYWQGLKIHNIPLKYYLYSDNGYVPFESIPAVKDGTFTYKILVSLSPADIKKESEVTVEVKKALTKEIQPIESVHFNYAFFSFLYPQATKPATKIVTYVSDSLKLKTINYYLNDNKISELNVNDTIHTIDISGANAFASNKIKLEFIAEQNGKTLTFVDEKEINVSDIIKPKVYHSYDEDKKVYRVGVSLTSDEQKNVTQILWRIEYNSIVMQHILDIENSDVIMKSSVIFEKYTDASETEFNMVFKQAGDYEITAYVIDTAGNIHIAKNQLTVLSDQAGEEEYKIEQKIEVVIRSKEENPVFKVYKFNDTTFELVNAYVTQKLFGDLYKGEFTLDTNDSIFIVKIGKAMKTYRVGNTSHLIVLKSNEQIDYVFKDFDGKEIQSGKTDVRGDDIATIALPKDTNGVLQVGNKYKIID